MSAVADSAEQVKRRLRRIRDARQDEAAAALDARDAGVPLMDVAAELRRSVEWVRRHVNAEKKRRGRVDTDEA